MRPAGQLIRCTHGTQSQGAVLKYPAVMATAAGKFNAYFLKFSGTDPAATGHHPAATWPHLGPIGTYTGHICPKGQLLATHVVISMMLNSQLMDDWSNLRSTAYPPITNRRRGIVKGDDLKAMSIDELWNLHEAVTFELNQKIAAEKTQLEQRLHELQGNDDLSGPDLTTTYRAPIWRTPRQ